MIGNWKICFFYDQTMENMFSLSKENGKPVSPMIIKRKMCLQTMENMFILSSKNGKYVAPIIKRWKMCFLYHQKMETLFSLSLKDGNSVSPLLHFSASFRCIGLIASRAG